MTAKVGKGNRRSSPHPSPISFRPDASDVETLGKLERHFDGTRAQIIRIALRELLQNMEGRELMQEALNDLADVVPTQEDIDWAERTFG